MTSPADQRTEILDALRGNPQRVDAVMRYLFDPESDNESLSEVRTTVHRLATDAEHCPEFPDCREERYVRDEAASIRAGEPVGRWLPQRCAACDALAKTTN